MARRADSEQRKLEDNSQMGDRHLSKTNCSVSLNFIKKVELFN
jgi:hypothetical protein